MLLDLLLICCGIVLCVVVDLVVGLVGCCVVVGLCGTVGLVVGLCGRVVGLVGIFGRVVGLVGLCGRVVGIFGSNFGSDFDGLGGETEINDLGNVGPLIGDKICGKGIGNVGLLFGEKIGNVGPLIGGKIGPLGAGSGAPPPLGAGSGAPPPLGAAPPPLGAAPPLGAPLQS